MMMKMKSSSLYVGDLDPAVTEQMLCERFGPVGPLLSVRLCRDKVTHGSLGYAYVNFHRPEDAERVLDTMNFNVMNGKPMRMMWSQRDPSLRKSGVGNVFIKNLEKSMTSEGLLDIFSSFGSILSCRVACDENGSKGFGFVHFETLEAAEKAISQLDGMLINNQKVFVGHFKCRSEREAEMKEKAKEFTNVYIKNFGSDMDKNSLDKMFSKFGQISSTRVMTDESGNSRGFGFVNFEKHSDAQKAVEELNGVEVMGRRLYVGRAQKRRERQAELRRQFEKMNQKNFAIHQGVNLYVKNLSDCVDTEVLHKEFSPYGTITSCKVMLARGRSKGFGFVCFSSPEEATKAVSEMNGRIIANKPLYVALAQRKKERQAQLMYQNMRRKTMFQSPDPTIYHPQVSSQVQWEWDLSPFSTHYNHIHPNWPTAPGFNHEVTSVTSQILQPDVYMQTPESLNTSSPSVENQKQMLGHSLFPLIQDLVGPLAGKITGMLLESDDSELFPLLQSHDSLSWKVNEALHVLKGGQMLAVPYL